MRKRLVRVLPWLVTAGLLLLLFLRTSVNEVLGAARSSAGWTLPVGLACVVGLYIFDSFAMWRTFGWFLAKMSFSDVLLVRGATYLLAAINYNVGQGAIVYFVHRTAGTSIMRGAATVLLVMGTNVLALAPRVCVMVKGNPRTRTALEKAGASVYEYEGREISLKGGGGPTCLTRPLTRSG